MWNRPCLFGRCAQCLMSAGPCVVWTLACLRKVLDAAETYEISSFGARRRRVLHTSDDFVRGRMSVNTGLCPAKAHNRTNSKLFWEWCDCWKLVFLWNSCSDLWSWYLWWLEKWQIDMCSYRLHSSFKAFQLKKNAFRLPFGVWQQLNPH